MVERKIIEMSVSEEIARQIREVHFGVNWTWSNLREHLTGLRWEQATRQVYDCNSIATLVHHMNYYLNAVSDRVQGKQSESKHEESLRCPEIRSQADWERLLDKTWKDAEDFAALIAQLPDDKLWETISEKYGSFYRNILGVVEHNHYHLGQIVLLKKILTAMDREQATQHAPASVGHSA